MQLHPFYSEVYSTPYMPNSTSSTSAQYLKLNHTTIAKFHAPILDIEVKSSSDHTNPSYKLRF